MILKVTEADLEDFYEPFARICFGYLCERFPCSLHVLAPPDPPLRHLPEHIGLQWFIHSILTRTVLHPDIICSGLFLLDRLRVTVASAREMRGEALLVAAFMVAHKYLYDDFSYGNALWSEATQSVIPVDAINCYERELLANLRWNLDVHVEQLSIFKTAIGWPKAVNMKGERFREAMEARGRRSGGTSGVVRKLRGPTVFEGRDVKTHPRILPNGRPVPIKCLVTPAFAPWSDPIR